MNYQTFRVALFAFFFTFYLFGCGHRPPVIVEKEVKVPVTVACISPEARAWLGQGPKVSDTPEAIQSAPNIAARVNLMNAGREERDWWIEEALKHISICYRAPLLPQALAEEAPAPSMLP